MSTSAMTIRVDSEVKTQAQQLFTELGMDMTTAINVFLRQAIFCGGLPFDVRRNTSHRLTQTVMEDCACGRNVHGPFESVEAFMDDLKA